jgi:hypothetical protein
MQQADAPLLLRALQRDQEHDLKHCGSVDLISTNKTNKQPCFIHKDFAKSFGPVLA